MKMNDDDFTYSLILIGQSKLCPKRKSYLKTFLIWNILIDFRERGLLEKDFSKKKIFFKEKNIFQRKKTFFKEKK
jgi:hypothetical protein